MKSAATAVNISLPFEIFQSHPDDLDNIVVGLIALLLHIVNAKGQLFSQLSLGQIPSRGWDQRLSDSRKKRTQCIKLSFHNFILRRQQAST